MSKLDLVTGEVPADDATIIVDLDAVAPVAGRRAKIICTIGPSSNSESTMRELLRLGMDVARLNFSHGSHQEHARSIRRLRRAAKKEGRTLCILQDLQGPKIRTGRLKGRVPVMLEPGSRVVITPRDLPGTEKTISTTFPSLAQDVGAGDRILLSDGRIELRVLSVEGEDVECEVINGGLLGEHQGINIPGTALTVPSLTDKDYRDLEFGLKQGVDYVALSFVRSAADVLAVKQRVATLGHEVPIIAKLEKPQAIEQLDDILEAADAVMIARGDLGVELPAEKVPVIQKRVIRRAAEFRKPVITATQMLESMIADPRPTRAEASDVANAIFDGTDAVMLSAETASGKYPREAVAMMSRIVVEAERNIPEDVLERRRRSTQPLSIAETICESVAHAAQGLDMGAIAVFTESGNTAKLISKYRPKPEIFAFSHIQQVCNRLNLLWGVHPVFHAQGRSIEAMVSIAERVLLRRGKVRAGEVLGVVAGTQLASGSTNFMRLHVVMNQDEAALGKTSKRSRGRRVKE